MYRGTDTDTHMVGPPGTLLYEVAQWQADDQEVLQMLLSIKMGEEYEL